jgi:ABC-type Na+ efflux pump permease subunit
MARLERPGDEPSLSFSSAAANGCVMQELGKILAFFGVILLVLGAIFLLLGRTTLPIGRLPGDILYRGKNTTFYFPLTTSLLLSVVLSLALYLVNKLR